MEDRVRRRVERLVGDANAGEGVEVGVAVRVIAGGQAPASAEGWGIGEGLVFPAASTIKLAILVALFRAVDGGRVELERRVAVEPGAVVGGSGVLAWLEPGLALPVADLAYLMVAVSDNTASNLLLDLVGIEAVGAAIADLGLNGTAVRRRFLGRLPGSGEPENVTTAGDLVGVLAAIAEDRAASAAGCARMRRLLELQQDRDGLARRLGEGVVFGGKPGSLPGLVHDAGWLRSADGSAVAVAVLTRGIDDRYRAQELIGEVGRAIAEGMG